MDCKKEIIEMIEGIENEQFLKKIRDFVIVPGKSKANHKTESENLLQKIVNIVEILPVSERQRTYDYLQELYFH